MCVVTGCSESAPWGGEMGRTAWRVARSCHSCLMDSRDGPGVWDRVLLGVVVAVVAYAIALVVSGLFLGDMVFDRLGFGPDDGDIAGASSRAYLRLVYGILGAVIVGWMTTIGLIVIGPLRRREKWAWWAIVSAVAAWFVLDTGLSVVLGFVGHALFNVAFAVALAVPLAAIKSEMR